MFNNSFLTTSKVFLDYSFVIGTPQSLAKPGKAQVGQQVRLICSSQASDKQNSILLTNHI
jgi:hypothetical protein